MRRLSLTVRNLDDADTKAAFERIVRTSSAVDGQQPFSDQSLIDVASGARTLILAVEPQDPPAMDHDFAVIGAAVLGHGELEFVIEPEWRGNGYGAKALGGILANTPPNVKAWAHGDHPASRKLAAAFGFEAVRTLLQLRLDPAKLPAATAAATATAEGGLGAVSAFRPGMDETEWLSVNALAFSEHPEQGKLTMDDLLAREGEPWFDAEDFLLARDPDGRIVGFNWLKVEDGHGEIYAIGVLPEVSGRGLGRLLMLAGLDRLRERGVSVISLYVEADSAPAVRLYRSLGFTDHTIDVQYSRPER